jgi:hypothetical protein
MKQFLGTGTIGSLVVLLFLEGIAATSPLLEAPWNLHVWWPAPVACAGFRCVTFRQLAGFVGRTEGKVSPTELLTRLLARGADRAVAGRTGLAVSDDEINEALSSVERAAREDTGLRSFLDLTYGNTESEAFREGFRDLLLARKVATVGVDVWARPWAPTILVLHTRYAWNAGEHRVVTRAGPGRSGP